MESMITSKSILLFVLYSCLKFCHSQQNHGAELQQSVNLARQEYVQEMCDLHSEKWRRFEDLSGKDLEHVLVDRERRLVYCYVPKVACTNWKRVLLYLTYKDKNESSRLYQKLSKYNITDVESIPAKLVHENGIFENLGQIPDVNERLKIVNEYTRFVMVRHPFDRLLSAYRNKLQGDSASALYFQSRIGKYIVKNFRKNPTKESLERGHDVTFREFCEYLISIDTSPKVNTLFTKTINERKLKNKNEDVKLDLNSITEKLLNELFYDSFDKVATNKSSAEVFNEHWMPAFDLCHPCVIKYNVIGKYETLIDDARLVLSLIDPDNRVRFPQSITHYYPKTSENGKSVKGNQSKVKRDVSDKLFKGRTRRNVGLIINSTYTNKNSVDISNDNLNKEKGSPNMVQNVQGHFKNKDLDIINNNISGIKDMNQSFKRDQKYITQMYLDIKNMTKTMGVSPLAGLSQTSPGFNQFTPQMFQPGSKKNLKKKDIQNLTNTSLVSPLASPSSNQVTPGLTQSSNMNSGLKKKDRLSQALSSLSVELLEKLYWVYENDFKVFGYGLENLLGYEIA